MKLHLLFLFLSKHRKCREFCVQSQILFKSLKASELQLEETNEFQSKFCLNKCLENRKASKAFSLLLIKQELSEKFYVMLMKIFEFNKNEKENQNHSLVSKRLERISSGNRLQRSPRLKFSKFFSL
jgi:penicillin-binding protein-related factor A (putative recombinase)